MTSSLLPNNKSTIVVTFRGEKLQIPFSVDDHDDTNYPTEHSSISQSKPEVMTVGDIRRQLIHHISSSRDAT